MGVPVGTYGGHENGARALDDDVAVRYGKHFKVRWSWILRGEGSPGPARAWVPVIGYVGAGGEIYSIDDYAQGAAEDQIEKPPGLSENAVALRVKGDSMWPAYRDGDLLVYDSEPLPPANFLTKECVIRLRDGRTYIKVLMQGSQPLRYTLMSYNAPPMPDEDVEWAAPVGWVMRR